MAKITKRAEEFRDLPDALQRNLQTFLTLTMDILAAVHAKVKASSLPEVSRQAVSVPLLDAVLYAQLKPVVDDRCAAQEVACAHHLCGEPQVQDVARRVFSLGALGRRDRCLIHFAVYQ